MRFRVILLVVATSSLVLVSFLVPLALVLRSFAANEAVSKATTQAQSLAPCERLELEVGERGPAPEGQGPPERCCSFGRRLRARVLEQPQ